MSIISTTASGQKSVTVEQTGARIPIVASLDDVNAGLGHSARCCIVQKENLMLVWSEDPASIINVGNDVEKQLLGMVIKFVILVYLPSLTTE